MESSSLNDAKEINNSKSPATVNDESDQKSFIESLNNLATSKLEEAKQSTINQGDSKLGRQNITEVFRINSLKKVDTILRGGFGSKSYDNSNQESLYARLVFAVFRKTPEELNKNQWHPTVFFIALLTSLLAGIGFIMTVRFLLGL